MGLNRLEANRGGWAANGHVRACKWSGSESMKKILGFEMRKILIGAVLVVPFSVYGQQAAPDNTAVNKGDQSKAAVTADQGKNNKSDLQLARQIRRDVVKDKTLSTYGHNVKIIAQHGKVTLKGPVHTEDEKKTILSLAQKTAGDGNVVDQLTVKSDN
jgi:hyperosmotically inducible periplasmic protein